MIYSFAISTPANTLETSKQATDLQLTAGIIHQLDIVFPTGCAGLAYIGLSRGLNQVWPTNGEEFFHTDGEAISFKEFYNLMSHPHILTAYTYNLDDTYSHTIIVRIGLLKQSEIQGVWMPWEEETEEELIF